MPHKSPYASKNRPLGESHKLRLRQQKLALRRDLFRFEAEYREALYQREKTDSDRRRKAEMNRQNRARMNEILRKHGQDELPD